MRNENVDMEGMRWIEALRSMPRGVKKFVQIVYDLLALSASYILSIFLLFDSEQIQADVSLGIIFISLSLIIFSFAKIYRVVVQFSGFELIRLILASQFLAVLILYTISIVLSKHLTAANCFLLFFSSIFAVGGGRFIARRILDPSSNSGERVLIYGVGKVAVQLMASIRREPGYCVVGFIDDGNTLNGFELHGIPVFSSDVLEEKVIKDKISIVILADKEDAFRKNKSLLNRLESIPVLVKSVPFVTDFLKDENSGIDSLEDLQVDDIVGRENVIPDKSLLKKNIFNKVVLVTGAGGSIGSEICRQVISLSPKRLILLDASELALFNIEEELSQYSENIDAVLGSVCDKLLVDSILSKRSVDTVYHAAAYKHVPLVETNPIVGMYNNVLGTETILEASNLANVKSFTLISTDKAVRPTNVMGASKRISEIICQILAAKETKMKISIVRFGNVIESSGSVIPKFREQIRRGGPVTVTHPDVSRFFMGIPEASELVIQASSLARGGDVFVLDMGNPVKISELVGKLIRFSGKNIEIDGNSNENTIKIVYTGLRPGEKLHEELSISGESVSTVHPKIKKMKEGFPKAEIMEEFIKELKLILNDNDINKLKSLLINTDIGYTDPHDHKNFKPQNNSTTQIRKIKSLENVSNINISDIKHSERISRNNNKTKKSFLKKISMFRNKVFLNFLHKYFLFSRALTMGVRCILLNNKNEVLLVKHTYIGGWHLPGGGIGIGESAYEAVSREVYEETSYSLKEKPELIGIRQCKNNSQRDHVLLFYSEKFLKKNSNVSSFEISACEFYPINKLPDDIDEITKVWISEVIIEKSSKTGVINEEAFSKIS